jgi:K+/H+ antiporter YhaU regulatory subunit KhtT
VIPNPGADLALESGDAVGVLGTPEQRAAFREMMREPMQDDAVT